MITESEIKHIANLAKLNLGSDEMRRMRRDLEGIIGFAGMLEDGSANEAGHISEVKSVYREDAVLPSMDRSKVLSSSPMADKTSFLVPKVLEQEGGNGTA